MWSLSGLCPAYPSTPVRSTIHRTSVLLAYHLLRMEILTVPASPLRAVRMTNLLCHMYVLSQNLEQQLCHFCAAFPASRPSKMVPYGFACCVSDSAQACTVSRALVSQTQCSVVALAPWIAAPSPTLGNPGPMRVVLGRALLCTFCVLRRPGQLPPMPRFFHICAACPPAASPVRGPVVLSLECAVLAPTFRIRNVGLDSVRSGIFSEWIESCHLSWEYPVVASVGVKSMSGLA